MYIGNKHKNFEGKLLFFSIFVKKVIILRSKKPKEKLQKKLANIMIDFV